MKPIVHSPFETSAGLVYRASMIKSLARRVPNVRVLTLFGSSLPSKVPFVGAKMSFADESILIIRLGITVGISRGVAGNKPPSSTGVRLGGTRVLLDWAVMVGGRGV